MILSTNPSILLDGPEVCSRIRAHISCPILFLTARVEDGDKVIGFGAGADDYIVKPFSMKELGARVAAHLRREHRKSTSSRIRFDNMPATDYTERRLYRENTLIPLAPKEFDILELLSRRPGQVFSKEQIKKIYQACFIRYRQREFSQTVFRISS